MREEEIIEVEFINKLKNDLKYTYREDIRDKESLELNFKKKFESLNRVKLTDAEFSRLKDEIISDDVFKASKTLSPTLTPKSFSGVFFDQNGIQLMLFR